MECKAQTLVPLPASPAVGPGLGGKAYPAMFQQTPRRSDQPGEWGRGVLPTRHHPHTAKDMAPPPPWLMLNISLGIFFRRRDVCPPRELATPKVHEDFGFNPLTRRKPILHLFCAESLACMISSDLHHNPMGEILSLLFYK